MGPDIFMYDKHLDCYDKNVYIFIRINNHIQKLIFKRKKQSDKNYTKMVKIESTSEKSTILIENWA